MAESTDALRAHQAAQSLRNRQADEKTSPRGEFWLGEHTRGSGESLSAEDSEVRRQPVQQRLLLIIILALLLRRPLPVVVVVVRLGLREDVLRAAHRRQRRVPDPQQQGSQGNRNRCGESCGKECAHRPGGSAGWCEPALSFSRALT